MLAALAAAALACGVWSAGAEAKGVGTLAAPAGVTVPGSPHRYIAIRPRVAGAPTVVARIARDGGRLERTWYLRGDFYLPGVDYGQTAGGLAADERTLVLSRLDFAYPPRESGFAVLDLAQRPRWAGGPTAPRAFKRIGLRGFYSFDSIAPDGSTVFLRRHLLDADRGGRPTWFELRALDPDRGRLYEHSRIAVGGDAGPLNGLPVSRASSAGGRWSYTLYDDVGKTPYLLVLDTVRARAARHELPRLADRRNPFLVELKLGDQGRTLTVLRGSAREGGASERLFELETAALRPDAPDAPTAGSLGTAARLFAVAPGAALGLGPAEPGFLAFTQTPREGTGRRPANILRREGIADRTASGQPVRVRQLGDPALDGELVVFECAEGQRCDAGQLQPNRFGCPDPGADVYVVPSPVPDDGDGIAARIVRRLTPAATVWLRQRAGAPAVRAWGPGAVAGRRLARRLGLRFLLTPPPAGSLAAWQGDALPGAAAIAIELPPGPMASALRSRLNLALARLGREVSEDGRPPRRG